MAFPRSCNSFPYFKSCFIFSLDINICPWTFTSLLFHKAFLRDTCIINTCIYPRISTTILFTAPLAVKTFITRIINFPFEFKAGFGHDFVVFRRHWIWLAIWSFEVHFIRMVFEKKIWIKCFFILVDDPHIQHLFCLHYFFIWRFEHFILYWTWF